jgi:predicted membrane metal-binding protein
MEGLAASVLLIAILLGVLQIGVGILLVLLTIGLWAGIRSASNTQPQPAGPLICPTGPIWALVQGLCPQL